jgi:hypothetical protein
MADDDSPTSLLGKLGSKAEAKPKLPAIQTSEAKTEKPTLSTPPTPSAEFLRGYNEGYKDAKAGKKPRAHT